MKKKDFLICLSAAVVTVAGIGVAVWKNKELLGEKVKKLKSRLTKPDDEKLDYDFE